MVQKIYYKTEFKEDIDQQLELQLLTTKTKILDEVRYRSFSRNNIVKKIHRSNKKYADISLLTELNEPTYEQDYDTKLTLERIFEVVTNLTVNQKAAIKFLILDDREEGEFSHPKYEAYKTNLNWALKKIRKAFNIEV